MVQEAGLTIANIGSNVKFLRDSAEIVSLKQAVANQVTIQVALSDPLSDGAAWRLIQNSLCFHGGAYQDSITIPTVLVSPQHGCFNIRNVLGDGRCLFRALSLLSTGDESKYVGLFEQVISHVKDHWQCFQTYIALGHQDQTFTPESYSLHMQLQSSFGTIAELVAAAQVLQAHIRVFSIEGRLRISTRDSLLSSMDAQTCYDLGFIGSQDSGHYVALELISCSDHIASQGSNGVSIATPNISVATPNNADVRKRKRSGPIGVIKQNQQFYAKLCMLGKRILLGPFDSDNGAAAVHDFAVSVCCKNIHSNVAPQHARSISGIYPGMLGQLAQAVCVPTVVSNRCGNAVWTSEAQLLVSCGESTGLLSALAQSLQDIGWHAVTDMVLEHTLAAISVDIGTVDLCEYMHTLCKVSTAYKAHIKVYNEAALEVFWSKNLLAEEFSKTIYLLAEHNHEFQALTLVSDTHLVQAASSTCRSVREACQHPTLPNIPMYVVPLNVNGTLIDFYKLNTNHAEQLRDLAVIATKQRKHLKHPCTKYLDGHNLLRMPRSLYEVLKPLIKGQLWVSQKHGSLLWTDQGELLQSLVVTRDHCTALRSLAMLLRGKEELFVDIEQEIDTELCARQDHHMFLAKRSLWVQMSNIDEYAHADTETDAAGMHMNEQETFMCQLSAAAEVLHVNIVVWEQNKMQHISSNQQFGFEFAETVNLVKHHCIDGPWYEPLKHVIIVSSNEWCIETAANKHPPEQTCAQPATDDSTCDFSTIQERFKLEKADLQACQCFLTAKADRPMHICFCCHRMFFRKQVTTANASRRRYAADHGLIAEMPSFDGTEYVCNVCKLHISRGTLSEYAVAQGYALNLIPDELKGLTELEQRLVAANTPFMQIRKLPVNFQRKLTGAVINVPNDLSMVLDNLPSTDNLDATIMVRFKRKLAFKHAWKEQAIRPGIVIKAIQWLTTHAPLWSEWNFQASLVQDALQQPQSEASDSEDSSGEGSSEDEPMQVLQSNQHSVVQPLDAGLFAHDHALSIAPAEGSKPVCFFKDKLAEEKAYPNLFGGFARNTPLLMYYSRIARWELMHYDGRFRTDLSNIFFKMFKLRIEAIAKLAQFKLRHGKLDTTSLTRRMAQDPQHLQSLANHDVGFHDFRTMRGSPAYFAQAKKDAFAMLRQCGKPTWFFSLSAADTHWGELLRLLHALAEGTEFDGDVQELSHIARSGLVANDPVTCVRYFHHRAMVFIQSVLCKAPAIIGTLSDFFVRMEDQSRGTMHLHGLGYTPGAPVWDEDDPSTTKTVCAFVDRYVTCSANAVPQKRLQLQIHSHNRHCNSKKRGCKALFPRIPMPFTTILRPLASSILQPDQCARLKSHSARIHSMLEVIYEDMKAAKNKLLPIHRLTTFEALLTELQMTLEEYTAAIAFTLERPTLFLKRMPNEIMINNYSPIALMLWEANIDIQYVLDPYSAASYATAYMTKADKGNSQAMIDLLRHLNSQSDITLPEIVRRAGNALINSQEICIQEACYLVLGLPLRVSTRRVQFVPTMPREQRFAVLRSSHELASMDENSSDVVKPSIFDHYSARPDALEAVCLADFIGYYERASVRQCADANPIVSTVEADGEGEEVIEDISCDDAVAVSHLPQRAGQYRRRRHAKVLRWVNYSIDTNRPDYFRELLLLFKPWRDECSEINLDPEAAFTDANTCILVDSNAGRYSRLRNLPKLQSEIEADADASNQEQQPNLTHPARFQPVDLHDRSTQPLEDPDSLQNEHEEYDILPDMTTVDTQTARARGRSFEKLEINLLPQTEYHQLVNKLNLGQRRIFNHVIHAMRSNAPAWHVFVSGGAGVGKSFLLRAIDQAVKRIFLGRAGSDLSLAPVVTLAPTGTAAFQVSGLTIHSAMAVPANKDLGSEFNNLTPDKINSLRATWANIKLVIIDEISMVGCRLLQYVNLRLQQIKGSTQLFGGIPLLVIGDMHQLRPVMDGWAFLRLSSGMAALVDPPWLSFKLYELTDVMRQDNMMFINRLNRLRTASCTAEDLAWWQSRVITRDSPLYDPNAPHLFQRNSDVNLHNEAYLQRQPGELMTITAVDTITSHTSQTNALRIMARVSKMKMQHTANLALTLNLKLNVPVELTTNIDVSDGLTNGATGRVANWSITAEGIVAVIYVQFPNPVCGAKARAEHSRLNQAFQVHASWTPIVRANARFRLTPTSPTELLRQQFPVRLCAARTIHRVQGQSLQTAIIDFKGRSMPGLHYVGASRVICPTRIWFLNFNPLGISASKEVSQEYQRMRSEASLQLNVPTITSTPSKAFVITALNARSLHHNIDCVRADPELQRSDFLAISETWALPSDCDSYYNMADYDMRRFDSPTGTFDGRPHRGIALYTKVAQPHMCQALQTYSTSACDIVASRVKTPHGMLSIICIYRSPQMPMTSFLERLTLATSAMPPDEPLMILGDFNVDIKGFTPSHAKSLAYEPATNHLRSLVQFMLTNQCRQIIQGATSDSNLQIDHLWTNIDHFWPQATCNHFILESFYSDHRPIGIVLMDAR